MDSRPVSEHGVTFFCSSKAVTRADSSLNRAARPRSPPSMGRPQPDAHPVAGTPSLMLLPQQQHAASYGKGGAFETVDIDTTGRLLATPILTVPSQYVRPGRKMTIGQHTHDLAG